MTGPSPVSPWPTYPEIPIFLDPGRGRGEQRLYGTTESTPQSPLSHTNAGSIRYITTAPPSRSKTLPVPLPEPVTVFKFPQQQPKRPALSFFPTERPRVRFGGGAPRTTAFKVEKVDLESGRKDSLGLGIADAPSNDATTPIRSPTARLPVDEKVEPTANLAQRIEQKLWRYSSSRSVIKRWLLEIISWLLSAICMGTIVGVLIYLRGGKLPKWPYGLTLNAFIAVLSKIASASLLLPVSEALGQLKWSWFQDHSKKMWDFEIFDNASRGPWGSILLLIRTKGKALAALGALVTLFSLALDPFFQQVVSFPECWTYQGNSSIPKVHIYNGTFGVEYQGGAEVIRTDQDIQAIAEKFFYDNGTQPMQFGNGTRPDIPLSCPTSNCTWPAYDTLGVCNSCADVSELLSFTCLETTIDWTSNLTGFGTESSYPNGTVCGYWLNSTVLMSGYLVDPDTSLPGEALLMRTMPLTTNPERTSLYGGSINFKDVRAPIIDALIVSAMDGIESIHQNQTPVALECVLSWCIKTVKSSYWQATYKEEIVQTFRNTTPGTFPWTTTVFTSPELNGTYMEYPDDISIDASAVFGRNASGYGLSNNTAVNTIAIFDDVFPAFTTMENSSARSYLRYKTYKKANMLRYMESNPWLSPNNITSHMDRLATALTNIIRSSSSNEMVNGSAYTMERYVSVQWYWLVLPLGLLVMSLVFLVATIARTAMEEGQVGVWKTSAIATLLYGLPDDMQKQITSSSSGTPRAKAKQLRVRLLPMKGWRISGNLFTPMTPKARQSNVPPGWI